METTNHGPSDFDVISDGDYAKMAIYNGVGIDFKQYRSAALLPEKAWRYIDETVNTIGHDELVGIADLKAAPGVLKAFDGMAAEVYEERRSSGVNSASIATSPDTRGEGQKQDYDTIGVPMLVTYQDYLLNTKKIKMAARVGLPIDTNLLEECTISVTQTLEQVLFNGLDLAGNVVKAHGYQVYGYTNFPDREQVDFTGGTWVGGNPQDILADVIAMMQASREAKHNGPWTLYIPFEYQNILDKDYLTGVGNDYPISGSIQNRLMQLEGLDSIKISNYLALDNVILAELKPRTVRLIEGMPLRSMAWEAPGTPAWRKLFKVMTITVPFLKSDYAGNSGIVHGHLA